MSVIEELKNEIEEYPKESIELEITDVELDGDRVNVNENGKFRVRIANRGALHVTGVSIRVRGLNGARVKHNGATAQFGPEFVHPVSGTLKAHGGELADIGPLWFEAPSTPSGGVTELVGVTLEDWDANLDHILEGHSDPSGDPQEVYRARVFPV